MNFKRMRKTISSTGNIPPNKRPVCRLSPAFCEIIPTRLGPIEPPKSPAIARRANKAVPPVGIFFEEMLSVPGHIMPIENPQSTQPASATTALCDNEAII